MSQVKVFIRPPPHKNFVQGYPSIPASPLHDRPTPHLAGTVEVRPSQKGIYAAYLHLEFQKVEIIPSPKPLLVNTHSAISRHVENINPHPIVLWSSPNTGPIVTEPSPSKSSKHRKQASSHSKPSSATPSKDSKDSSPTDSSGNTSQEAVIESAPHTLKPSSTTPTPGVLAWAPLASGDFDFHIPLPDHLPPSLILDPKTGTGISYVLRATLCARPRHPSVGAAGWFRRNSSPLLLTASTAIEIVRHDLHSTWPIYRPLSPDLRTHQDRGLTMEVVRRTTALGPGDEITARIRMKSQLVQPIKINRFEINLTEVITYSHPTKPNKLLPSSQTEINDSSLSPDPTKKQQTKRETSAKKSETQQDRRTNSVVDVHARVQQTLIHRNSQSFDVRGIFPPSHSKVTVTSADHISIHYLMRIRAVLEPTGKYSDRKKIPTELIIRDLPVTIGDRDQARAKATMEEIGLVPLLCLPVTNARPEPLQSQPTRHSHYPNLSPLHTPASTQSRQSQLLSPNNVAPSFTGIGAGVGIPFRHPDIVSHQNGPRPYPTPHNPPHSRRHDDFLFDMGGVPRSFGPYSRQSYQSNAPDPYHPQPTAHPSRKTWGYHTTHTGTSYANAGLTDDSSRRNGPGTLGLVGTLRTTRSISQPPPESPIDESDHEHPSDRAHSVTPSRQDYSSPHPTDWPTASTSTTSAHRLIQHPEALRPAPPPPAPSHIGGSRAEEEKRQLFMRAKAEAERTQSLLHSPSPPGSLSRSVTYHSRSSYLPSQRRSFDMIGTASANGIESSYGGRPGWEASSSSYSTAEEDKRVLSEAIRERERRKDSMGEEARSVVTTVSTLPRYGALGSIVSRSEVGHSPTRTFERRDTIMGFGPNETDVERILTSSSLGFSLPPDSPTRTFRGTSPSSNQLPGSPLPDPSIGLSIRQDSPPPPPVNLKTRPSFTVNPYAYAVTTPPVTLIDPQREAYLRAVAQREAYFSCTSGLGEMYEAPENERGVVLSALEEKERLRREWEEQQQLGGLNGNTSSGSGPPPVLSPSGSCSGDSGSGGMVGSPMMAVMGGSGGIEVGGMCVLKAEELEKGSKDHGHGTIQPLVDRSDEISRTDQGGLIRMPTASRRLVTCGNWFEGV